MSDASSVSTLQGGRYAIIGVLGAGSQAETLDAVDKRDGRAVAIKRFQVRGAKSWKDVELAEREARVLSTLSHPNLPVYIEHFEEQGALYLVMEKIEGETLSALRRRKATLSATDVARFLSDAANALGYLHSRVPPIIHRDIKPGNVIRRADGSFAFVDFGSVRDQLKPEGGSTVVGTFGYMAPEQFQGRALPASDVYAVGATAISLLTGREPEELPHRGLALDVPAALGRNAEPWLVRALSSMLEPNPDLRAVRVPEARSAARAGARDPGPRDPGPRDPGPRDPGPDAGRWRAGAWTPPAAEADWQTLREQGREARRRLRDETRRFRHEMKDQIRDETRRARREARRYRRSNRAGYRGRRGFGPLPLLLISALSIALSVARLAVWALFRVFLPTLLFALSPMFGPALRRAAWRCREIGFYGDRGLQVAIERVRAELLGEQMNVESEDLEREAAEPSATSASAGSRTTRTRVSEAPLRVEIDNSESEQSGERGEADEVGAPAEIGERLPPRDPERRGERR